MKTKNIVASIFVLIFITMSAQSAGELVRYVRGKISAGDLDSGIAAVEDYKNKHGVDAEYLDAVGWLARGSELLKRYDKAEMFVAELRREIPEEKDTLITPLGSAIEVEGKLRAAREGKGGAVRFLENEFAKAKDIALRSRIRKNINLLIIEGRPDHEINPKSQIIASLKGKPVLVFFWAQWCGDAKAQAKTVDTVLKKYQSQGLVVIAPTRLYGTVDNKPVTPDEERAQIKKVWAESYTGLENVTVTIDDETMVRYGVSATPTIVLIDKKGIVRNYKPTRLSEAELSSMIEAVLGKK